jgi:glycosyltransferase involved in cell wall biosynthesis
VKIVHLSTYDINGGAARAAWRLHDSLRRASAESSMFVAFRDDHDPDVKHYRPAPATGPRLKRILRREFLRWALTRASRARPAGFERFRDDRTAFGSEIGAGAPDADVYHLHQITDFVDYRASLLRLATRAPIVWTLHEMTPFTGGCPYAYECPGFTLECGTCPQLGSSDPQDLSRASWMRKRAVYQRIASKRMHVVGASRWIAEEAKRSSLFRQFPVSVIPYGLDTEVFRPRREARRLLDAFGVKSTARVVLFLADYAGNRRKGFALLDSALGAMRNAPHMVLVSLGRDLPKLQSDLPHLHLGSFTEERMIALVYSMADLFIIPSLQDNLPNTVLESMACGTPVVGFRVGGIPDMVRDGENGLLVPPGNVAELTCAIQALLADEPRRVRMGSAGRAIAEREYTLKLQAESYLTLYRSLTGLI